MYRYMDRLPQPNYNRSHYNDLDTPNLAKTSVSVTSVGDPDRAPLKEVLGGQYNYREGGRQVLRQGAKRRRRIRKWQCSKDPCAQKVSGGRTDPSPKYRWKVHG